MQRDTPASLSCSPAAGVAVESTYGAARGLHHPALLLGLLRALAGVVLQRALGAGASLGDALG